MGELGPNFSSDLLFVHKSTEFVGSGEVGYKVEHEPAVCRLGPQHKCYERKARLITWAASCTRLCRRPQLVFIPKLAEKKCRLLLLRMTTEKSIIDPKNIPIFFKKSIRLWKKLASLLLVFCGKPRCHDWLNSGWEKSRICMTKAKEEMTHHWKVRYRVKKNWSCTSSW